MKSGDGRFLFCGALFLLLLRLRANIIVELSLPFWERLPLTLIENSLFAKTTLSMQIDLFQSSVCCRFQNRACSPPHLRSSKISHIKNKEWRSCALLFWSVLEDVVMKILSTSKSIFNQFMIHPRKWTEKKGAPRLLTRGGAVYSIMWEEESVNLPSYGARHRRSQNWDDDLELSESLSRDIQDTKRRLLFVLWGIPLD